MIPSPAASRAHAAEHSECRQRGCQGLLLWRMQVTCSQLNRKVEAFTEETTLVRRRIHDTVTQVADAWTNSQVLVGTGSLPFGSYRHDRHARLTGAGTAKERVFLVLDSSQIAIQP